MYELVSWIEYMDNILFLTSKELTTKEGRELKKYLGEQFENDIKGHGAIRKYYGLKSNKGNDRECNDFSSTKKFPPEIVKAIKEGLFEGIGIAVNILTPKALAEYKKVEGQALAEYKKVRGQAWTEYKKVEGQTLADYKKVQGQALAEYEKVQGQAFWSLVKIAGNRREEWK